MNKDTKKLIWIGIAALVVIGGGILAYTASQPGNLPKADPKLLVNENSHTSEQGTRNYTITLVEFGDYQCPACAYAQAAVEELLANNPQVKLVFRQYPLPMHEHSMIAAEAAEAAGAQGKFWEMHKALFTNQDIWVKMKTPMDAFVEIAKKLNLDVEKFKQDVETHKFAERINKDREDGTNAGVQGTPTFFINGKLYSNGLGISGLQRAIDAEMKLATPTQETATK